MPDQNDQSIRDRITRMESQLVWIVQDMKQQQETRAAERSEDRHLVWHLYAALTTLALGVVGYLLTHGR